MNPGWIRLHRMPMRSEVEYEPMRSGVNLLFASVVKTTANGVLNRSRSCFIVVSRYRVKDITH